MIAIMKKSFAIVFTGVLALALAGCEKEVNIETVIEEPTHSVVFTADKIIDTKTAIASESNSAISYKWIAGDEDRVRITESYEYDDNGETKTSTKVGTINSMNITNNGQKATFNVTFTGDAPDAEVTYKASYAGTHSGTGNPLIPAAQSPLADTFDPAADVLVSDPIVKDARDTENDEFIFDMTRKVSVNKMTLKGLEEGEVISSVTFESDKQHSAYYAIATDNYSGNGKKLTFTYTANNTVPASGEFPVYFTTAPVENATFTVTVTTDKNVYQKTSSKTISFACGQVRRFGVDLEGYGTPITEGTVYTLVESQDDLYDGATYIIVGTDVDYAAGLYTGGNNHPAVAIEKSTNVQGKSIITIDNTVNVEPLLIERVGENWTIKNNASENTYFEQYLICGAGNNNRLQESESIDRKEWTISISNGVATINNTIDSGTGTRTQILFNQNNGSSPMFACYAPTTTGSNYHSVALYVDLTTCVVLSDPELSFNPTSVSVDWDDKDSFVKPTLTNPHSVTVTYSSSDEDVATVDATTGDITFVGNGTTTITASSAKTAEYKSGTAFYSITVSGKPVNDYVTLDWTYPEGDASATSAGINAISGVTTNGLGTDYAATNAPYLIKFDTTDDYIQVKTDSEIGTVSVKYKMIGGGNTSSITFAGSSDGENWTDVQTLSISGSQNDTGTLTTTSPFNSNYRYVKMTFTKGSNVGIGGITITKNNGGTPSPEQLVMSDVSCTNSGVSENSLSFRWNDVANATGYQVSTDGTTFGSTQTATTYTLTGLSAGTTYTIWVKAIGDGTNYTDSAAKQSASGTTKTSGGAETIVYTLTPANGTNNSYAKNCDIVINGITWNLTGNSQMIPWRIGGNNITSTDRALYSKTALNYNISKIEITHGAASSITVNSMTVIVASDANFNNVVSTLTPTFAANSTVTVNRPDGKDWSNCYYKIVYNVTVSGSNNRFIEFTKAEFTGK